MQATVAGPGRSLRPPLPRGFLLTVQLRVRLDTPVGAFALDPATVTLQPVLGRLVTCVPSHVERSRRTLLLPMRGLTRTKGK